MTDLLKFESDLMTIQIIANSLSFSGLSDARGREAERKKYISKIGYLYPSRSEMLSGVTDFKMLVNCLSGTPYEEMLKQVSGADGDKHEAESNTVSLDDVMLQFSARKFSEGFEGGFHVGAFYSFLKLREQEIKNVTWLAELISMQVSRNLPGWNKFVVPFKYHVDEFKQGDQWGHWVTGDKVRQKNVAEIGILRNITLWSIYLSMLFL